MNGSEYPTERLVNRISESNFLNYKESQLKTQRGESKRPYGVGLLLSGFEKDDLAKKYTEVRVIHQENKGYGEAMLRGIQDAKKEFVCYMPADGQFLVRDMIYCLPLMEKADLILGARGSRADYSTYRLILSYTYLIILRILFGIKFQDINWLNIWNTKKVQELQIDSRGIFILAEIVIKFQKKGYRVMEGPSYYRPRHGGRAKNSKLSVALKTFFDACRLWIKLRYK